VRDLLLAQVPRPCLDTPSTPPPALDAASTGRVRTQTAHTLARTCTQLTHSPEHHLKHAPLVSAPLAPSRVRPGPPRAAATGPAGCAGGGACAPAARPPQGLSPALHRPPGAARRGGSWRPGGPATPPRGAVQLRIPPRPPRGRAARRAGIPAARLGQQVVRVGPRVAVAAPVGIEPGPRRGRAARARGRGGRAGRWRPLVQADTQAHAPGGRAGLRGLRSTARVRAQRAARKSQPRLGPRAPWRGSGVPQGRRTSAQRGRVARWQLRRRVPAVAARAALQRRPRRGARREPQRAARRAGLGAGIRVGAAAGAQPRRRAPRRRRAGDARGRVPQAPARAAATGVPAVACNRGVHISGPHALHAGMMPPAAACLSPEQKAHAA